jgi:death-on-curing protein
LAYVIVQTTHVISVHARIIGANELQGLAKDKSLDAVLNRVHNRLQYGFIADIFDLAACYGTFIAKGHCFHDANKRTAASVLFSILSLNQVRMNFSGFALGEWVIDVATDKKTEVELAAWLRSMAKVE